jgi:hypothetical protein
MDPAIYPYMSAIRELKASACAPADDDKGTWVLEPKGTSIQRTILLESGPGIPKTEVDGVREKSPAAYASQNNDKAKTGRVRPHLP